MTETSEIKLLVFSVTLSMLDKKNLLISGVSVQWERGQAAAIAISKGSAEVLIIFWIQVGSALMNKQHKHGHPNFASFSDVML